MATTIEVESKYELDGESFERVKLAAPMRSCADQLNVYYDNHWLLADHAATFRVRFCTGQAPVLTLKLPISRSGETRTMREFEYPLSAPRQVRAFAQQSEVDVDRELPPEIIDALFRIGVTRLERVGRLRNRRCTLDVHGIGSVELDELHLPDGQTIYEAEIESEDPSNHERLVYWLRTQAPRARPSRLSKFQRFRAAMCEDRRGSV